MLFLLLLVLMALYITAAVVLIIIGSKEKKKKQMIFVGTGVGMLALPTILSVAVLSQINYSAVLS